MVGCGPAMIAPISSDAFTFSETINSYSEGEQLPVAIIHHRLAMVSVDANASCQYAVAKSDDMFCFFFLIAILVLILQSNARYDRRRPCEDLAFFVRWFGGSFSVARFFSVDGAFGRVCSPACS